MLDSIWSGLKDLAGRKKFQAAIISIIVWGVGKAGLDMSPADLLPFVGPLWLFIFGQALADFKKSAAELAAPDSE